MLCVSCKPLDTKIETIIKDKPYKADDELYILGNINIEDLKNIKR